MITGSMFSCMAYGDASAVFDTQTKQIEITGTAQANARVTVKAVSNAYLTDGIGNVSDDKIAYFMHTYADKDGQFIFRFKIAPSGKNGNYTAFVNGGGLDNAECGFILIDDALVADMLEKLNKASEEETKNLIADGLFTVLEADSGETDYYSALEDEYKSNVILSWLAARQDGGYKTKEEACGGFYSACGYARLKKCTPSEENRTQIEEYIKNIFSGLGRAALWNKYEGNDPMTALGREVKEKTYTDALEILKDAKTSVEFCEKTSQKMILNMINNASSWVGYKNIIDNPSSGSGFSEYIKGIDRNILERNETNALKLAYNGRRAEYTDIADFAADINKFALEAANSTSSDNTPGGGGGGGGGSRTGTTGSSVTVPSVTPAADVNRDTSSDFTDMDGYAWAADAVAELAKRNIIGGMGGGKFAPGENVTREQFVKMLVLTFGVDINENTEVPFSDCVPTDWSYPYIAGAYEKGYVLGADGKFGRNDFITRQDAAVMVYRFMQLSDGETATEFNDDKEIAEYAKAAVSSLGKAGVISGTGEGKFSPKENMTRAQAAKMLWNVINR